MNRKPVILIVEDEDSIRLTLRDYLKKKGHEVIVASDGVGAIKQILDQVIADKEQQLELLQKEIEDLKSAGNKISSLVAGVSFTSAADLLEKAPPSEEIPPPKRKSKSAPDQGKESSAQWEKYINNDAGDLLAKLVYDAETTTIIITKPEIVKLQKTTPLFQDFFIQKILISMKEDFPALTLDFQETKDGFLRQITISQMGSEENFAKIEKALDHLLKKMV